MYGRRSVASDTRRSTIDGPGDGDDMASGEHGVFCQAEVITPRTMLAAISNDDEWPVTLAPAVRGGRADRQQRVGNSHSCFPYTSR